MPLNKLFPSADDALADAFDGSAIMVGGCGSAGIPHRLLHAMARRGGKGITCIGEAGSGSVAGLADVATLVAAGQVSKLVTPPLPGPSWPDGIRQRLDAEGLTLEVVPPGILAERIRAGGAGVGGLLVLPQSDPALDAGKERQALDGREYVLETPLRADFALVRAHMADTLGNLVYSGPARNWNPVMATAAGVVIAEVDQVVEPGGLDPEMVITQGIYVDRIIVSPDPSAAAPSNVAIHEVVLGPFRDSLGSRLPPSSGDASAPKVYPSAAEAVADVFDGAVVLIDGFAGPGGMAHCLLLALRDQGAKELTMVSNTAGVARAVGFGTPPGFRAIDHSVLVDSGQIKKAVASFPVSPSPSRPTAFEEAYRRGEVELELVPQGTLAERIRAGGVGVAAFYTPTGAGTAVAEGKPTRHVDGREQVLERAIRGDFALLRARKADRLGNLVYRGTSRNFNAVMAPAARVTIVEVDEIVEPGQLDPEAIVTPGIFVDRIVQRPPEFAPYEPAS